MNEPIHLSRRDVVSYTIAAACGFMLPRAAEPKGGQPLRAPVDLVDAVMLDVRARRQVRLVREIMGERVVALTFFFTGCSTVCPMQSMSLSQAQELLGSLMGEKVVFASVSIDWLGDTAQAIEDFARSHQAGPHWHFLKGPLETVDKVRRGFDSYDPRRDDHPPVIAIGRVGVPAWSRLYGFPTGEQVAAEVRAWSG